MRKGDSTRLEALEALLAEKRKHEGYLAKLEERRAGTPEHVFARLRDEYMTKLTDAQVKAASEAESLSDGLAEDEAAVKESLEKLAALEEEKVEAELRAAVGEIDPKEWQKKLTTFNAAISMAEKERDARKGIYERTQAMLTEALGNFAASNAPAPSSSGESPSAPMPTKPRPTQAMAGGPNFDELAFLNSVVTRPGPTGTPAAGTPSPGTTQERLAKQTPAPERVSKPTPTEGPSAPMPPRSSGAHAQPSLPLAAAPEPTTEPKPEPAPEPKADVKAPEPKPAEPKAEAKPKSPPKPLPEDEEEDSVPSVLGRPTPRTSQAIKTLKCAECGSMNYPTEWYCERCGGELAAL
jgi:hypothetical protein